MPRTLSAPENPIQEVTPDPSATSLAAELSAQVGETVQAIDPRWRQYAQQGVVIEVNIHREQFKRKMTLADLGIEIADEKKRNAVEKILAPGHLYLIPMDEVRRSARLGELARENLERWGNRTFWGWWVHLKAFDRWKNGAPVVEGVERQPRDWGHDEIRQRFDAIGQEMADRFDELRGKALEGWQQLAAHNWDRLKSTPAANEIPDFWDREKWIKKQIARFDASLPSPEEIKRKYRMAHKVWMIPTQEMVQADLIRAGDRTLDAARADMMAELERSARAQVRGSVEQFAAEVRAQLNAKVFVAVAGALKIVRGQGKSGRKGKIGRNNVIALRELLDASEQLLFWDEGGSFQADMDALRGLIETPSEERSAEDLERVLTNLSAEAKLTLVELDQQQQRINRRLGEEIPEVLDEPSLSDKYLNATAKKLARDLRFGDDVEALVGQIRRPATPVLDDDDDELGDVEPAVRSSAGSLILDDEEEEILVAQARVGELVS